MFVDNQTAMKKMRVFSYGNGITVLRWGVGSDAIISQIFFDNNNIKVHKKTDIKFPVANNR